MKIGFRLTPLFVPPVWKKGTPPSTAPDTTPHVVVDIVASIAPIVLDGTLCLVFLFALPTVRSAQSQSGTIFVSISFPASFLSSSSAPVLNKLPSSPFPQTSSNLSSLYPMASGPPSGPSAPTPSESSPPSNSLWEGDRMFNIYIYDYCNKRGFLKTARELVNEAEIPVESQPPINAKQGLLFEWWSVFWVLFQAKNNGTGSDDGLVYTQHQAAQRQAQAAQRQGVPNPPPPGRFTNGIPPRQAVLPPGGPLSNGVGPAGPPPPPAGAQPAYGMPHGAGPQPNGIPVPQGLPGSHPGGPPQNFSHPGPQGPGQRQMVPQHRGPNGAPFPSPTMAHSPQAPPMAGQQQPGPMAQLGPSPQMNHPGRAMLPPGPQQIGNPSQMGSAHPTPTQPFQQLGRPPSRQGTPSHMQMNPTPSPSLAPRQPPVQDPRQLDIQIAQEIARLPPDFLASVKLEVGLGDKDERTFTSEDKQRIMAGVGRRRRAVGGQVVPNAVAGPSTNMPPQHPQRNQQQPMSQQPPRPTKRNSTSPSEEHETLPRSDTSPPDRKRVRRTPNPHEPPMAPMGSFPSPSTQGHPGITTNGMVRSAMNFQPGMHMVNQPGMNMSMGQGMTPMQLASMSPMMGHPPPPNMMTPQMQQQQAPPFQNERQYRATMMNIHQKNMSQGPMAPLMPGPPNGGSPSANDAQAHMMRGAAGQPQPGPHNRVGQPKTMGGMHPPGGPKPPQTNIKAEGSDNAGMNGPSPDHQQHQQHQQQHQQQQPQPQNGPGQGPPGQQNNGPPAQQQGQSHTPNMPTTPASGAPTMSGPSTLSAPSPSAILSSASGLNPPRSTSTVTDPMSFNPTDFLQSMGMSTFDDLDGSGGFGEPFDGLDFWINNEETLEPMK